MSPRRSAARARSAPTWPQPCGSARPPPAPPCAPRRSRAPCSEAVAAIVAIVPAAKQRTTRGEQPRPGGEGVVISTVARERGPRRPRGATWNADPNETPPPSWTTPKTPLPTGPLQRHLSQDVGVVRAHDDAVERRQRAPARVAIEARQRGRVSDRELPRERREAAPPRAGGGGGGDSCYCVTGSERPSFSGELDPQSHPSFHHMRAHAWL